MITVDMKNTKENALSFLMKAMNASEYESPSDDLSSTWESIAYEMVRYSEEVSKNISINDACAPIRNQEGKIVDFKSLK